LANFFDLVHHQRLLARIAERVKDQRILVLINMMLKATVVMPDGTRVATQKGTPQGGPLSPLLSNCPSSKHLAQSWRVGNGERASSGVGF